MIRRHPISRNTKTTKTQSAQKENCSRVGSEFQVNIPPFKGTVYKYEDEDVSPKEIKLWSPDRQPREEELRPYFETASKHRYSRELAMLLLHWHKYNIKNAKDDIPNYTPISNKWTKCEVKKFLKCVDSKPRKDFAEVRKTILSREVLHRIIIMRPPTPMISLSEGKDSNGPFSSLQTYGVSVSRRLGRMECLNRVTICIQYDCRLLKFPGRRMGEISSLYYSIAAPFKARTRAKYHGELIEQCFTRAVRNGLVVNHCHDESSSALSHPHRNGRNLVSINNSRKPGEAEDPLEREVELHLVSMMGMPKARRLLGRRILSTPYPLISHVQENAEPKATVCHSESYKLEFLSNAHVPLNGGLIHDSATLPCVPPVVTNGAYHTSSSSGASSQLDSESTYHCRVSKYSLPTGIHYNHEEFVNFLATPEDEIAEERELELSCSDRLNAQLCRQAQEVENRAKSLLAKINTLKPACGFPVLSYRWTRTELALFLTAMSRYGNDFATIARTLGTKSESFLRDYYNQFRRLFPLDEIMHLPSETPDVQPQDTAALPVTEQASGSTPMEVDSVHPCNVEHMDSSDVDHGLPTVGLADPPVVESSGALNAKDADVSPQPIHPTVKADPDEDNHSHRTVPEHGRIEHSPDKSSSLNVSAPPPASPKETDDSEEDQPKPIIRRGPGRPPLRMRRGGSRRGGGLSRGAYRTMETRNTAHTVVRGRGRGRGRPRGRGRGR